MDLPRAVGGDDDDGRLGGLDGAELGNGDLEIRQHLQQIGLEGLVGAVELVDQQDRRAARIGLQRLEQGPLDEEALRIDVAAQALAAAVAGGLGQADLHHLAGIIPLIDRRRDVEPLIALQAHQAAAQGLGEHLGDLRLAHPGLALQEQRPAQPQRQEQGGRQAAVGHIAAAGEQSQGIVDAGGEGRRHQEAFC